MGGLGGEELQTLLVEPLKALAVPTLPPGPSRPSLHCLAEDAPAQPCSQGHGRYAVRTAWLCALHGCYGTLRVLHPRTKIAGKVGGQGAGDDGVGVGALAPLQRQRVLEGPQVQRRLPRKQPDAPGALRAEKQTPQGALVCRAAMPLASTGGALSRAGGVEGEGAPTSFFGGALLTPCLLLLPTPPLNSTRTSLSSWQLQGL